MKGIIIKKLKYIEDKEHIKILYAVESGSRAWGFESKDSDFDIRFIYVHPLSWYLSIEDKPDVIEYPISDSLDISGWDIKKSLELFKASNPPLYEWLSSPIVYLEQGNFVKKLRSLMPKFYSPVSCLYHYLSMTKGNYKAYLTKKKVKLKKYFYALRPILACMWIKQYKTMPPMEFDRLLEVKELDPKLTNEIQQLLERKKLGEELVVEDRNETISDFLKEKMDFFEDYAKTLGRRQNPEEGLLDRLFRDTLELKNSRKY